MKRYVVRISKSAQNDIYQVIDHISNIYKAKNVKQEFERLQLEIHNL